MVKYIVDVQGFKTFDNKFIFKEISFVCLEKSTNFPTRILLAPPFEWNKLPRQYQGENRWLEHNYHGLRWGCGEIPYETGLSAFKTMLEDAEKIYVKGFEKRKWLQSLFPCKYVYLETNSSFFLNLHDFFFIFC